MADRSIQLSGFAELDRMLALLPDAIARKLLSSSMSKGARVIRDEAKRLAPVRVDVRVKRLSKKSLYGRKPGFLRASIAANIDHSAESAGVPVAISINVGKAFYASFLEFGTRHQGARPFLRPAADNKFEEAVATVGADLGPKIEAEAARLLGK